MPSTVASPVVADDVTEASGNRCFSLHVASKNGKGIQCLILVLYLLGNPGVKSGEWVKRGVFHEKDRRIGMLAAG